MPLQSQTQPTRGNLRELCIPPFAAPPHCHLSCHRIATNAARKLQEERGKGQHGWVSPCSVTLRLCTALA